METYKEIKSGNKTIKIVYYNGENPREWDNLAKMLFVGKYQHLGDKHNVDFNTTFYSREHFIEMGEQIVREHFKDVAICYPVHLYQHSGASISISNDYPYNCRWDSGTIGFAIITKEDIRKNWDIKNVTKKYIEHADKILKGEVETLNQYVMGEIFGFIIEDENGEHIDSCYGFYGTDFKENGMAEHMDKEFAELLMD